MSAAAIAIGRRGKPEGRHFAIFTTCTGACQHSILEWARPTGQPVVVVSGDDEFAVVLRDQMAAARGATAALLDGRGSDPEWPLRVAEDCLRALGFLLLAWAWARMARVAACHADDAWYADKRNAARFGVTWLLPEAGWLWQRVGRQDAILPPAAR